MCKPPSCGPVRTLYWQDAALALLDQRRLPHTVTYHWCTTAPAVAEAIRLMVVRGAPAIGIAAAYGMVLSAQAHQGTPSSEDRALLAAARPTAVNLFWALEQMATVVTQTSVADRLSALLAKAQALHAEDIAANRQMGALGAALLDEPCAVLTHCNAGALATGGYGTALGVIRSGVAQGLITQVYADETRPWWQGARLTAWELVQEGIPVTLLPDGAAAALMQQGQVRWVIVGADRIAMNGDVANKIGTYGLAIAARYHGVRLMVVAPSSTIDPAIGSGAEIPIEHRAPDEVLSVAGQRMAALGAGAWNPAFDVTPAALVDAIVTERGVVLQPNREKMQALMHG